MLPRAAQPGTPLAIVTVNYGSPQLVRRLLDSLHEHPDATLIAEVVVVDNGFPDRGDARAVIQPPDYAFPVRFVQNRGTSYASGANRGAALTTAPFVAISNNDLEWPRDGGIVPILECMNREPDIGVAGPGLRYPDGAWQRSYGSFPSPGERLRAMLFLEVMQGGWAAWSRRRGAVGKPKSVDFVDGAFMVIRRSCFDQLGGFDEHFSFYAEDADFCWRAARAGWRRVTIPSALLVHVRGASSREIDAAQYVERLMTARQAFVAKHFGRRKAEWFMRLERVASSEMAAVYAVLGSVLRTPGWKRRMRLTRIRARAMWQLPTRLPSESGPRTTA